MTGAGAQHFCVSSPIGPTPNAVYDLVGLSLGEAFFKFVLGDPEVKPLSALVMKKEGYSATFQEGQYPGSCDYNWPLDVTASELAYQFVRPILIDPYRPDPKASPEICQLCEVIVERFQILRGFLTSGHFTVVGTHVATGNIMPMDLFQWKRRGLLLDVQSSDILDAQRHPPILRWSGLSLQLGPTMNAVLDQAQQGRHEHGSVPASALALASFHVKPTEFSSMLSNTLEPSKRVSRQGIARAEATIKDAKECRHWLVELMRKSPNDRMTAAELWVEAKKRWPKLSKNAFSKARAEAIQETGAVAWAAAGAPKKLLNR